MGVLAKPGYTGTAKVGDVSAKGSLGIYAHADGGNTNVTAGAVTGTYNASAVRVMGANATADVTVDSVNATIERDGYTYNQGVHSEAGKNGKLNVKVKNDVSINANERSSYLSAVHSKTTDPSAESNVTIDGDVNVVKAEYALKADANNGGTAKLTATNVTATDVSEAVYAHANKGETVLNTGIINGLGNTSTGLHIDAYGGGTLTANAGDISVARDGGYGLRGATSAESNTATVVVGNIVAKGYGINLKANSGSTLNLKTGDIKGAEWNNLSVGQSGWGNIEGGTVNADLGNIESFYGLTLGTTSVEGYGFTVTTKSLTATQKALNIYAYGKADNPDKITVNGNVTSTGTDTNGGGIYMSSSPGNVDLTVNGDVTSNYYTIYGNLQGKATITGNVISTHDDDNIPAI